MSPAVEQLCDTIDRSPLSAADRTAVAGAIAHTLESHHTNGDHHAFVIGPGSRLKVYTFAEPTGDEGADIPALGDGSWLLGVIGPDDGRALNVFHDTGCPAIVEAKARPWMCDCEPELRFAEEKVN